MTIKSRTSGFDGFLRGFGHVLRIDAVFLEEEFARRGGAEVLDGDRAAGIALPWYRWIGDAGRAVSIEHFGASAPGELLFKEYGIDAEHVAAAAKESIEAARS